jgi:hypothetical protein
MIIMWQKTGPLRKLLTIAFGIWLGSVGIVNAQGLKSKPPEKSTKELLKEYQKGKEREHELKWQKERIDLLYIKCYPLAYLQLWTTRLHEGHEPGVAKILHTAKNKNGFVPIKEYFRETVPRNIRNYSGHYVESTANHSDNLSHLKTNDNIVISAKARAFLWARSEGRLIGAHVRHSERVKLNPSGSTKSIMMTNCFVKRLGTNCVDDSRKGKHRPHIEEKFNLKKRLAIPNEKLILTHCAFGKFPGSTQWLVSCEGILKAYASAEAGGGKTSATIIISGWD